jgi:hypothetical protein
MSEPMFCENEGQNRHRDSNQLELSVESTMPGNCELLTSVGTMIQSSIPHVALKPVQYLPAIRRRKQTIARAPNSGVVMMICNELSSWVRSQVVSEYLLVAR